MKINMMQAATGAALLLGSSLAMGHTIDAGEVEAGSPGYTSAGGFVVKTGDGECLKTSAFSEENQVNVCEGLEPAEEVAATEPEAEPEPTVEPEPAPKQPTIIPVNRSMNADFATGSDIPTPEGEAAIAALIAELSQYQEIVSIDVAGHSDSQGSEENNQALSERRAATVRDRLAAAFPGAAISSTGYGESQPIATNDTAEGRANNRRVEVAISAKSVE